MDAPVGMCRHDYLACDGGPHLIVPSELRGQWRGGSWFGWMVLIAASVLLRRSPKWLPGDYGRACAAVADKSVALVRVGRGKAIVLQDPPMSAWGHSPEGWVDVYDLQEWSSPNLDRLIRRAIDVVPTAATKDTGCSLDLNAPDLVLMYAGDIAERSAYGQYLIPIEPGIYRVLTGVYDVGSYERDDKEKVIIYRLVPAAEYAAVAS